MRRRIEAHIGFLKAELNELDGDLDRALRESPLSREKDEMLRSVPGVGQKVSASMYADMTEYGALDYKK